ncbi:protein kinase [Nonomuraea sp. NPDC048882]|uniref:protein kinase domain-containing protein n=1 Tax=Nonomuraea sp. NPDC048882 TaxID=3154347 RepID=UPI0033FF93E2
MSVIAERVRGYRLLERAGQDGPWTTYLARAEATGAEVLVKTLACHRVDKRALKRIVRGFGFPEELAALGSVVPVLQVGATGDGRPYLVTPPHEGLTLAERPGRGLPLPLEQAMGLLRSVARAIAATHAAGGVHGRVKPENVVMTGGGVVLTGYAMSALTSIVELPDGTLPSVHAAPEELEGRPPVPASDVYALASMTYELLAGRPAFALDGPGSTARFALGVLTEEPPPLPASVPSDLASVLLAAMSKDPATRPPATALITAATPHGHPSPASPSETSHPALPHPTPGPTSGTGGMGQQVGLGLRDGEVDHDPTVRVPKARPGQAPTARLATPSAEGAAAGTTGSSLSGQERSGPRELVWTVDPDRSRVRPPAGPQPFLPPPPEVTAPPHAPATPGPGSRDRKVPLVMAGVAALAVLVGAGSVALAMSGGTGTTTARQQATTTEPTGAATPPDGSISLAPPDASTVAPPNSSTSVAPPRADRQPPQKLRDQEPGDSGTPSPPAVRRSADPATVATYRPKSLKLVTDSGTTVTLAWKAVRKNGYPMIIQQSPGDRLMSATAGGSTYTVGGLDPSLGYCFKVGSVVTLGRPSSVAWSSPLCIRGAAETGTRDDNQVQPPLVLPLATPPPAPTE